jgi:hypothetical protein
MIPITIFLAFIALTLLAFFLVHVRGRAILRRWAEKSGIEIVNAEQRWFFKGPYFWRSHNCVVFYGTFRGPSGANCDAYVRCGSFWWGIWSDAVDATWVAPPEPVKTPSSE